MIVNKKWSNHKCKMVGFMKSPIKVFKQNSTDTRFRAGSSSTNSFDSDSESDSKSTINPSRRTSPAPSLVIPNTKTNPYDDDNERKQAFSTTKNGYKIDFRGSRGFENQTVEELENYAVYKAEDTTKSVNCCLKIAENIREDAIKTLDMLHHQGKQIERTHVMAADMDKDLSKGEKLLSNLGGMFSKPWKPKKTREISGPVILADNNAYRRSVNHKGEREKLGVARSSSRTSPSESSGALQIVEVEKAKQDDALSNLSNILGDLKNMAVHMGSQLDRQNKALDHVSEDVDELNARVKGANQRTRHLLGK